MHRLLLSPLLFVLFATNLPGRTLEVKDPDELRRALPTLRAGDTLRLAPGQYGHGYQVANLRGTEKAAITIEGAPGGGSRFEGGNVALQFSRCSHLVLRDLTISGQRLNGLNIDDGGDAGQPASHLTLERVNVSRIGPRGNHDAIKLSGVDDFVIRECRIAGWAGQAIDMVGCHRGLIEDCTFEGMDGYAQTTGPQTKGGSEDIVIRFCRFENAGGRPLQLGGATGKPYFRPPDAGFEARRIVAHDNLIIGGLCAVAFPTLDGGEFHHNTIIQPDKWVFRILQEGDLAGLPPSRNVEVHHNLIVFRRAAVRSTVNIGPGTEPASFRFHHNAWFASDNPGASRPRLPSQERDGLYGRDPQLDPATGVARAEWAADLGRRPRPATR